MCSSTLGPAREPSLLMCPMSRMETPPDLPYLSRLAAHSRICARLPGEDSTPSVWMVCMESMTTRSGCIASICRKICSSEVSHSTDTSASWPSEPSWAAGVRRSARSLIWRALSSPLTYSTFFPLRFSTVCSTKVLLPMPGSPPSSTRLPGTSPPPSTRFSSPSPISRRGSASACMSLTCMGRGLWSWAPAALMAARVALLAGRSAWMVISFMVFQRPQAGHLPTHLRLSCPQ